MTGNLLNSRCEIRIGGKYIDFSAPTLAGEMKTLSALIQGKIALIDLWASWCGPCRVTSKSMIPVYGKYKGKGFTVVGVACEYKNTKGFEIAINHDKYPWINLIELDNANQIWEKYGVAGGGGGTFMVNAEGTIIAINPDAEELEKLLESLL